MHATKSDPHDPSFTCWSRSSNHPQHTIASQTECLKIIDSDLDVTSDAVTMLHLPWNENVALDHFHFA